MMDLSKYPIDKLFGLVASVIPGFTVLTLFAVSHPHIFSAFFSYQFLGYRMTLFVIFIVAFIVGNSVNTLFRMLAGAFGGIIGAKRAQEPYRPAPTYQTAPWRDQVWRTRLKEVLGESAPEDTFLVTEQAYSARLKLLEGFPGDSGPQIQEWQREKLVSEINDGKWKEWYDYYTRIILNESHRDFATNVHLGFMGNMEATALIGLVGIIAVPAVRHWWFFLFVLVWLLVTVGDVAQATKKSTDIWGTLFEQVNYLSELAPPKKGKNSG
jgi:hypothetical protein